MCLKSQGLAPIDDWPSCYFHKKYKLFLVLDVDDFKLLGPKHHLEKEWDLVRKPGLKIEDRRASFSDACMRDLRQR